MTTDWMPVVTVVVPAFREAADIGSCIEALGDQDYDLDLLDVVVVDGDSRDGTATVASAAASRFGFGGFRVLDNAKRSTPVSLNLGLSAAKGEVVCRVDARSIVPPDYVRRCVELLRDPAIGVVGGAQVARVPLHASLIERGIARGLRNQYATGLARYRRRADSGHSDTTYLGSFRTSDLQAVGGWDERFTTNQDYELNTRMRNRGAVWFEAGLEVAYRPRTSLRLLSRQYRRFGRWKGAAWFESGMRMSPRQVLLLAAPPIAMVAGTTIAKRSPFALTALAATSLLGLDAASGEPGPLSERVAGSVAIAVFTSSWWFGVAEQAVRHLGGGRLLDAEPSPA